MPLTVQTTVVPRKAVPAFQPKGIQRKHDPAPILNTQILVPIFCASCILTVAWQTNNQNGQTRPTLDFPRPQHGQHASKVAHQKLKTCQQDTIWHLFQKLPIRGDLMQDKMRDKSNIALMCTCASGRSNMSARTFPVRMLRLWRQNTCENHAFLMSPSGEERSTVT